MTLPIRARLAVVCGSLVGILVVGLGLIVYLRLEADLRASADDGLLPRAESLAADPPTDTTVDPDPTDVGDIFGQIVDRDGSVVASTPGLADGSIVSAAELATLDGPRYFDETVPLVDERLQARLLEMPTADGRVVVVGVAFDDQREALDRLLTLLAIGCPAAILLAAGVGWLIAGAALRPVERMRLEAESISGSEPGRRLPLPQTGDELASLGRSLNRMLDRLETAVERERRFVADASHELRTPLANLKAELDLALRRSRSPSELVGALQSASEETDRLSRLAEDLLLLATAENGRLPLRVEDVDVSGLVRLTADSFEGRAAALGVAIEASIPDAIRARVDGPRIRQAVVNLVDNALRESQPGNRVSVEMSTSDRSLAIAVKDSGRGFDPGFLPFAFEAFARADVSRSRSSGGAGLGLAIVRAIAEAHRGSVEAGNADGGGAVVTLHIPR
jgi:two-component system, OmpR family, sensor kinase